MKTVIKLLAENIKRSETEIKPMISSLKKSAVKIYPESVNRAGDSLIMMAADKKSRFLLLASDKKNGMIANFAGELIQDSGIFAKKSQLSAENAAQIRKLFPWTAPVSLRKKKTSIGCGDRLGRATPGHISAIRKFEASPVLAQQSMRELSLTGRTYVNVVDDVSFLVFQESFREDFGADGDHLKKIEDIETALDVGMTMITLDLSDVMKTSFAELSPKEIDAAFETLPFEVRERVKETYFDRNVQTGTLNFTMSVQDAKRCALMYNDAMDFAAKVAKHIKKKKGDADLEVSIDETTCPTKIEDHFYIINELAARKVDFVSVAPRFIGEFQKGIDYIGDIKTFEKQFAMHCELARTHGNYKISVHSGSDKFSVFPIVGRLSNSRLHLKTAGTSWLEAVRVISLAKPELYRKMHQKALDSFADAKKLYHVTTDLTKIAKLDSVKDSELPDYMCQNESRQLLHITYGAILSDKILGTEFFSTLLENEKLYIEKLDYHFTKHLSDLGIKRRDA
ncbi:MAG TPA: tagaturonate epimerase family protein [Victivallales bacterium]|nr:tagaturonate epimerase family protein [Victivallales bacterium]